MIGKVLKVKIDRPLGSSHPDYPEKNKMCMYLALIKQ